MSPNNFEVLFDGTNYDIKKFLKDHPGGVNTLQHYKGKSIAEAMEKHGHSNSAYHLLKDFKVDGKLEDPNLVGSVSANGRIITKDEIKRKNVEEIQQLEELESRLDWSKPILSQLHKVADVYETWVNIAVYKKCRLFENPLLETLTFTPWYVVPLVWVPIIVYLGYTQFSLHVLCTESCPSGSLSVFQFIMHTVRGFLVWTGLEYMLHRWVFHFNPGQSVLLMQLHFLIHGMHHKVPFDGMRQVFPPVPAFLLASILFAPFSVTMAYPFILLFGGLMGYLTYDMIHYYVHHGSPTDGTYLYEMKRYHSNHHFINHDKAFGISSKMWDFVFKTYITLKKLGFSLRW